MILSRKARSREVAEENVLEEDEKGLEGHETQGNVLKRCYCFE